MRCPRLAFAVFITAPIRAGRGAADRALALGGGEVAGLARRARATGPVAATAIRAALLAAAVRGAAEPAGVALVRGRCATAIDVTTAGGSVRAVLACALVRRVSADLVEAVALAAVAVLLAGLAVERAGVGLPDTLATTAIVLLPVVVFVVLALAVAPLAPVGVLAPLDAVPGLLGLNVIRRDTRETANERQRGEHSDNATPGASGGEGADEGIKSTWVHRLSPSLMARGGTGVGHYRPCANAFLQTLSILVQRCQI
jgi:hypothetical protein